MVNKLNKNVVFKFLVALSLTIFLCKNTLASEKNIVKSEQAEVSLLAGSYKGDKVQLGLNIKMQPHWHIYWRDAGDTGFPPALDWNGSENIAGVEFLWPAPKRLVQQLTADNSLESYIYENEVAFPIIITAKDKTKPIDINLNVSYAICSDICIPDQADLSLNINPGDNSPENLTKIEKALTFVPGQNGTGGLKIESVNKGDFTNKNNQFIEVTANSSTGFFIDSTVFVEGGGQFAFKNPIVKIQDKTAKFFIPVTFLTDKKDFSGMELKLTLVNGANAVELIANNDSIGSSESPPESGSATLLFMIIFGFLGGLILNVMPCVLPVLSIKLLGVIKHGGGKESDVTSSFLLTALGIIFSFIALAVITILLKETGENIGWGIHFQQPYFIIALVVILTLFAANMWGFYEINLPARMAGSGSKYEGMTGHFMSGVLATILATPCTAPFLGVAVGFAVTRGAFEIFSIFLAMALGLAFPYILFSIFPRLVTKLPKPGKWMVKVKHFMGFLLAIAAIWLIWVLSNQLGKMAASVLLILCMIKVLKLWAANHYAIIQKIKIPLLLVIIILSFTLPVKISNQIEPVTHELWEDFKPEHIKSLVENGKIVFVDVTADWCLTCKVNKLLVLDNSEIKEAFLKNGVVAMRANWTNHDENISRYLMEYERAGIPFNIIYGPGAPDGIILSELLSKKEVLDTLKKAAEK